MPVEDYCILLYNDIASGGTAQRCIREYVVQVHDSRFGSKNTGAFLNREKLRECEIHRKTHSGSGITCGNSNDTNSVGGKNEKNKNYLYYGT